MDPRRATTWAALSKTLALSILLTVLAEAAEARIVTIRWSSPEPSAAIGYRLYTRAPSESFGTPAYDGMPAIVAGVYSIPLTVSDGTDSYVVAAAYNSAGESPRSNEMLFAAPVCGNAVLDAGEQCDDGNTAAGDGCSASCQVEVAACGNGIRESGEACDDGNTTAGDGCNANCRIEACGNAVLDAGESCDDGNKTAGDGCSATCQIEVAVCGNGMLQSGEACDDGNTTAGDGCNAICQIEVCGNAVLDAGEQCDDGNAVGGDGCDAQCRIEVAGGAPYYLEVGGSPWTDPSSGQRWTTDQPYATGGVITSTPGVSISKTSLDPLYWTRRVGDGSGGIHFRLPVSALGPYRVRLHFAELGGEVNASGARVFDVVLEGGVVGLTDFDVFREARGNRIAVVRDVYVLVDDGVLDIDLVPVAGLPPMIAAIEVLEGGAPPASPKFRRH